MLSVEYFVKELQTRPPEDVIKSVQQDALASTRIIAMQKWYKNCNGQWRAACMSIVKAIKVLEGEHVDEQEGD